MRIGYFGQNFTTLGQLSEVTATQKARLLISILRFEF